jgi:farnesyl diphosphate synthase
LSAFKKYQDRINLFLAQQLNACDASDSELKSAMAYSLMSGGKRIRPLLVYATAESIQCDLLIADHIAAAIEMIHAYSLIHDDLPAMDDDDLRRGQATNHIKFGEATAILAGDALQSLAYTTLAQTPIDAQIVVDLVQTLSQQSGLLGMAGGQSLDLISENQTINLQQLETIHAAKTGALLCACVSMVVKTKPNLNQTEQLLFQQFAKNFGMAFQIIDDILDVTQDTKTLGKPANSDTKNNKATYPSLMGIAGAKSKATEHINLAYQALADLPYPTDLLNTLAKVVLNRDH